MMNLNNKGQSLVMFIVIIPILIIILTFVYDIGTAIYEKNSLSNTNYMVIDYGLSNIDKVSENDLIDLILKNSKGVNNVSVIIDDKIIDIKISKNFKGIFGKIINTNLTQIVSEYKGELIDDKKKIERIK